MKILFDYQTFSRQSYGGVSRYFYELITRVAAMSAHDVFLFMGLHINEYGLEKHRAKMAQYFGIKHRPIPHTFRIRRALNEALLRRFARMTETDVYHLTYFDETPRIGKRRVITVHDMIYERFPGFFQRDDPMPQEKRKAVLSAEGIICVSESTRQDVCEILNVPREMTTVIYHGNSLHLPANPANPLGRPYILYVGKRGGYKNFNTLLRAYASSRRVRDEFDLLCFGFERVTPEETRFLTSLGVKEKVRFLQGGDDRLAQCYAHASAFVYPSLIEGFGIPQLEAMYYGCPVIASDVPSMREIAADGALYFDPSSPDSLAEKLDQVLADSELRLDLTRRGYEREKYFSWDRCAEETVAFYQSIV